LPTLDDDVRQAVAANDALAQRAGFDDLPELAASRKQHGFGIASWQLKGQLAQPHVVLIQSATSTPDLPGRGDLSSRKMAEPLR
jgi:hypothetical protein